MSTNPSLGRWAGWFKPDGGHWQKVSEGGKSQCLDALMDLAEMGEMALLPAGVAPKADQRGQFRRGLPEPAAV